MTTFSAMLSGFLIAGYGVIGLFFLRFWRKSQDRLFAYFGWAFILLAVQRTILTVTAGARDVAIAMYGLRAIAFLIIIYAIIDKNRKSA